MNRTSELATAFVRTVASAALGLGWGASQPSLCCRTSHTSRHTMAVYRGNPGPGVFQTTMTFSRVRALRIRVCECVSASISHCGPAFSQNMYSWYWSSSGQSGFLCRAAALGAIHGRRSLSAFQDTNLTSAWRSCARRLANLGAPLPSSVSDPVELE